MQLSLFAYESSKFYFSYKSSIQNRKVSKGFHCQYLRLSAALCVLDTALQ